MNNSTKSDFSLAAFGGSVSAMEHFGRQLQRELAAKNDEVTKANAAFEWLERKVFEGKWDGTLGAPKSWHMAGPYRHELVKMRGNTLLEAIYNAMKEEK